MKWVAEGVFGFLALFALWVWLCERRGAPVRNDVPAAAGTAVVQLGRIPDD